jgi:hypothetical protein
LLIEGTGNTALTSQLMSDRPTRNGMGLLMLALAAGGGFILGRYPRRVMRYAVRGGLAVGQTVRELKAEIAENIEDAVQEEKTRTADKDAN